MFLKFTELVVFMFLPYVHFISDFSFRTKSVPHNSVLPYQASRGDERSSGLLVEHGANVLVLDDLGKT